MSEPSAGYTELEELQGLLRVAHGQRDDYERQLIASRKENEELRMSALAHCAASIDAACANRDKKIEQLEAENKQWSAKWEAAVDLVGSLNSKLFLAEQPLPDRRIRVAITRKEFLSLPIEARQRIMAERADIVASEQAAATKGQPSE